MANPILNREQDAIIARIRSQMEKDGLEAMLLIAHDSILYATGYGSTGAYESGKVGSVAAVIPMTGKPILICKEFEKEAVVTTAPEMEIITYPTWIFIEDYAIPGVKKEVQPDPFKIYRLAADAALEHSGKGKIGVESDAIPHAEWEFLCEKIGAERLKDCNHALIEARLIKTPWEIEMLRQAAVASELAMNRTAKQTCPGMNESDITRLFRLECWKQSPFITRVVHAHTVGKDFGPAYLTRTDRVDRGDIVRLDGGPAICGYNSDIARTYAVGGYADAEKAHVYESLYKGFEAGLRIAGPGVRMCDVFHEIEGTIKQNIPIYIRGHHGHSISCSRVTADATYIGRDETRVFEENMVFCMETPYYSSKHHSFNIEDTFVVTSNGIERFTHAYPTMIW